MSTSPSWFDQEKFSRLVKKVGPKHAAEPPSGQPGADSEDRAAGAGMASTSRISLVSKPPSLLTEQRALPALPRRTTPLPNLKTLFPQNQPPAPPPLPASTAVTESPSVDSQPVDDEVKDEAEVSTDTAASEADIEAPAALEGHDLSEVWLKMGQLNEELAHVILERDHAQNEGNILREELRKVDEALKNKEGAGAPNDEVARLTKERDDALAEAKALREQSPAKLPKSDLRPPTQSQELSLLTSERDQSRKEYMELRRQFETLKQDQGPKEESGKYRKELEQQLDGFRQKLEEKNKEITALKANPTSSGSLRGAGSAGGDEKLKEEVASLRDQVVRAKDEASIAQRGLALSQKALHETRDTLREATEGTSLSRHNFDNIKNECAILAQQNTVLQAQNDQLTRDLAAAKSKMTSRL